MDKHMVLLLVVMTVTLLFGRAVDHPSNKRSCINLVTVILTLFSGLRTWWFADLIKYYTLYRQCNEQGLSRVFEDFSNTGIRIFFFLSAKLGISYDVCLFLIAALVAISLGHIVYKYSPSPYWSYLIYIALGFYLFSYSGLKQIIAMSFLIYATCGIIEDNPRKFLAWTVVAGIFHAPAFVFLPAYFVAKMKFGRGYLLFLAVCTLCIFFFRDQIISIVSKAYYEDEFRFTTDGRVGGRVLMMIFILGVAAFMRPMRYGDKVYNQFFNLMVIAAMIQYFSMYNNGFTRLADYYYQFVVIFMPLMLESGGHQTRGKTDPGYVVRSFNNQIYLIASIGITLFALYFYQNSIDGAQVFLREYKFFWEIDPYSLYGT